MPTVTFKLIKGGGPKSTSAVESATALAKRGLKVLLPDLDPQRTCATRYVGLDPEETMPSLYHVFHDQVPVEKAIIETKYGFDLLPSNSLLEATEAALEVSDDEDCLLLRRILEPLKQVYDLIIIDPRPGKTGLTINATLAADWLIMPITAEGPALESLRDTITFVQEKLKPRFPEQLEDQEMRIFIARYKKSHNSHAPGVKKAVTKVYGSNVLDFEVPETIEFPRSFVEGIPLGHRLPAHPGSQVYDQLAEWIIQNVM